MVLRLFCALQFWSSTGNEKFLKRRIDQTTYSLKNMLLIYNHCWWHKQFIFIISIIIFPNSDSIYENWILHICHLRFLKVLGQIEMLGYLLIRCFSLSPSLRQCCWYTISNPTKVSFTKNVSILQYYGIDRHLAKDISLYTLLIRHKNTVWYLFHSKQNKENERKL